MSAPIPPQGWGEPLPADAPLSPQDHYDKMRKILDGAGPVDVHAGTEAIAHGVAGLLLLKLQQS